MRIILSTCTALQEKIHGAFEGEEPGKHKEHTTLPVEIGKRLVPIFKRLTDENLLKRCRNKTQNPNECLHSIIWKICPKSTFSGKRMVEIGVNMAMCQFAMGTPFQETLCHALGLMPGKNLAKAAKKRSIERVVKAAMATSDEEKLKRKRKKYARTKNELEKNRRALVQFCTSPANTGATPKHDTPFDSF